MKSVLSPVVSVIPQVFDGEFLRLKGEALLAKDRADLRQAEEWMRRAIDITGHQSAKSRELRNDDEPRAAAA